MSVISNNQLAGAAGQGGAADYKISRSLRFNSGDSSYLSRTPSTAGNRKTWTWSGWVKLCKNKGQVLFHSYSAQSDSGAFFIDYLSGGSLRVLGWSTVWRTTSAIFRDFSAWQHVVVAVDTTNATANDRIKVYVNGSQITDFSAFNNPSQNADLAINQADTHRIGNYLSYDYLDGYLADVHFIDGQALAPTDFGEFDDNNVWQPKEFTGSYGTHTAPAYGPSYGSDITSTEVAKTIDGDLSTYGVPTGDFIGYTYSASNEPSINIKWENTKSSSITVYIQPWVGGSAANSGTFTSSGGNSVTIAAGATLNTKFNFPSGYEGYFRVYTSGDGTYLRMYDTGGTRVFNSFHLDFFDNSSNAALGADSSGLGTTLPGVSFDGSGDVVSSADHSDFTLGTNDWTIEYFVNPASFETYDVTVSKYGNSSYSWWQAFFAGGSLIFYLYDSSLNYVTVTSTTAFTANKWAHVAIVRDGNTLRMYVDGVQEDTTSITGWTVHDSTAAVTIGEDGDGNYDFSGVISNVRIVNGTCLYPNGTAFTVPSTPLTNVTNTKLLCCQSSSSATAATVSPNTLTTSGDPFATSKNDTDWTVNNLTANAIDYVSSSTGSLYSGNWSQAFNGSTSYPAPYIFNTTSTVTLSTAISGVIELYVYLPGTYQGNPTVYTLSNGATYSKTTQTAEWISFGSQSNVTSISVNAPDPGSNVFAVRVDGTILVSENTSNIDSLIDTPTNYEAASGNNGGNYCTWNPIDRNASANYQEAPTNGNLDTNPRGDFTGTIPVTSGKWYWEITITTVTTAGQAYIGVLDVEQIRTGGSRGWATSQIAAMRDTGGLYGDGSTGSGVSYTQGDVLGFALDATSGKLWIAKNNTWINSGNPVGGTGHAFSGLSYSAYTPIVSDSNTGQVYSLNAGQRPFAYTPPTDFLSICTTNLPDPTIADGSTAFDVVTWNGNDTQRDITGLGFSPDLVWIKQRSATALHSLQDTVRGATKNLVPNDTQSEGTETAFLNAFLSDGFSIGTSSTVNDGSSTYVGFAWDGGDLATNSAYNQSQAWSSGTYSGTTPGAGYEVANAFNGSNSPGDSFGAGKQWGFYPGSATLTFPTAITLTSSSTVEFYTWHNTGSTGNITVTCSNGSVAVTPVDNANIASTTVSNPYSTFGASITAITVNSSGSDWTALAGIVIDGKPLVDAGIIPAGGLNSSVYNQSQTWSSLGTGTAYNSTTDWDKAFDGIITTTSDVAFAASDATLTWTPSSAITVNTSVTLYVYNPTNGSSYGTRVNGSYITGTSNYNVPVTLTAAELGGQLTSIQLTNSGLVGPYLGGVEVDGKLLVNNGVSAPNVPSIASTVRANPSAGFSIVDYSSSSNAVDVAHGLNAAPELIILKDRNNSYDWVVITTLLANTTDYLVLNSTPASANFGVDAPTSTTFKPSQSTNSDYIAYCFAPVEGYSKFGTYTGNGSSDGSFVYTGFRPKWIMVKRYDGNAPWVIVDTERNTFNVIDNHLLANVADAENGSTIGNVCDSVSNGFKFRGSDGWFNGSSANYIWAAFASHPFKNSRAR